MRRYTPWAVVVLASVAMLGATPPIDAQDVQIVRSTNAPVWGSELRLVEEVRIGTLDGADEYILGSVDGIAVGRDGAMFVADGQVPVIRMYDARGKFVRNVGRKGQGPGEYESLAGIQPLPDGRIAIWDNRNGRITLYTASGDLAGSHPATSGLFADDLFHTDRTGHFYVRAVLGRPVSGAQWNYGWLRLSPAGKLLDTIPIPAESSEPSFVLAGPSGFDRPFTRRTVTALSANGELIIGDNRRYSFDVQRRGAPVLRIERPFTPIEIRGDERREWEAWAGTFERNARTNGRSASFPIPDTKPAYSELRTDSDGRIWVRRYVTAQSRPGPERKPGDDRPRRVWKEPPTFDVFEPQGRFLGTVSLPINSAFYDARDRNLWVTVRGESDEEYVVRYRIDPVTR